MKRAWVVYSYGRILPKTASSTRAEAMKKWLVGHKNEIITVTFTDRMIEELFLRLRHKDVYVAEIEL